MPGCWLLQPLKIVRVVLAAVANGCLDMDHGNFDRRHELVTLLEKVCVSAEWLWLKQFGWQGCCSGP